MSTEENKVIARRYFEGLNKADLTIADELFSPDHVTYMPGSPPMNSEGLKQAFSMFSSAFPNLNHTLEDQIAEGEKVATRFTLRGTHQGPFFGIPPTGKQVHVTGITIHRIVNGKIVEQRVEMDMLGIMQQLGVIPAPGQAS
jgi:steroid delta-isomerase-like uncharacterized protein